MQRSWTWEQAVEEGHRGPEKPYPEAWRSSHQPRGREGTCCQTCRSRGDLFANSREYIQSVYSPLWQHLGRQHSKWKKKIKFSITFFNWKLLVSVLRIQIIFIWVRMPGSILCKKLIWIRVLIDKYCTFCPFTVKTKKAKLVKIAWLFKFWNCLFENMFPVLVEYELPGFLSWMRNIGKWIKRAKKTINLLKSIFAPPVKVSPCS